MSHSLPAMRQLSKIIGIATMAALSCISTPLVASQDVAKVANMLAGTWNEVIRTEPTCENKKYYHTFSLSADGQVLSKRFLVPYEGNFGLVAEERYRILYADEKSLMLFREGETFELRDTGDKVLRQLILDSSNTYAWRVYGMARDHRATVGGLRCNN